MVAATSWALIFHQDPAGFFTGSEFEMAIRLSSIDIAEQLIADVKEAAGK